MSSALFSNLISSDVLQETKLKPWYESVRGYLVFTNVVVSIYMIYNIKSDGLLSCASANASVEFAASTTKYANSYCTEQLLSWHQRNFGLVCLLCSMAIYLSYCWWLLIPSIKESFALIRECDDELKKLKGTPSDMISIIQLYYSKKKPNKDFSDDEISKLIVVSHRLWCGHSGMTNMFRVYEIRNGFSFAILVGVLVTLTVLAQNGNENPANCQLDILNGANAHCFIHAKDKLYPFVITILVVTSALCLETLALSIFMCVLKRTSRREDLKSKWTEEKGLSDKDLKKLQRGEDCNRFVEIFSEGATPFSENTKILMYFSMVIDPKDNDHSPDRFLSFTNKMKTEAILNVKAEGHDHESNTEILNKIRDLHGQVREGEQFHEFLSIHEKTFNNRFEDSDQDVDDHACQCETLFAGEIKLDNDGTSLMHHALSNLDGAYKQNLAAHLVLSTIDEDGNVQLSSRVTFRNKPIAISSKEFMVQKRNNQSVPDGSTGRSIEENRSPLNRVYEILTKHKPQDFFNDIDGQENEGDEQANETTSLMTSPV